MKRENNQKHSRTGSLFFLVALITFVVVFAYLSLNLKNIDSGYQLQDLMHKQKALQEEIDKLKSEKARLLNLGRVEAEVVRQLGYQYPTSDQFIKVFEDNNENK